MGALTNTLMLTVFSKLLIILLTPSTDSELLEPTFPLPLQPLKLLLLLLQFSTSPSQLLSRTLLRLPLLRLNLLLLMMLLPPPLLLPQKNQLPKKGRDVLVMVFSEVFMLLPPVLLLQTLLMLPLPLPLSLLLQLLLPVRLSSPLSSLTLATPSPTVWIKTS